MLQPLPRSHELLVTIREALGSERMPLIIGVDGRWGAGKSSLASWLAWQLEMPAISLDLYIIRDSDPLKWRYDDLSRVITARLSLRRPVIVEGICICRALRAIGQDPNFLVWVENETGPMPSHQDPTREYLLEFSRFFAVWSG